MHWLTARLSADGWRWSFVALGVLLRLFHWLRDPAAWQDETALILNVLNLDFGAYFGHLLHHQAAPPLFLVLERAVLLAFGDSTLALRIPLVIAGCVSVFAFSDLARRVLSAGPAALAVGLFAVSDRLLFHTCEVKPYALDVLVAVLVGWAYVRTREWPLPAQCALWGAVLPLAEWVSYPACFLAGGVLLGLLPVACHGGWRGRLAYVGLGLVVLGAFAALALGPAAAQRDAALGDYWAKRFADWGRPWWVPVWAVTESAENLRYALRPLGQVLFPVALVGAIRLVRSDSRMGTVLLAPVGLCLAAALVHKYPYGAGRLNVFLAPSLILLVAAGTPPCWNWLRRWGWAVPLPLALALALPVGQAAYRSAVPWPRMDFRAAVAYVEAAARPGDLVTVDLWESEYYTRHRAPDGVCKVNEIASRRPPRVWVLNQDLPVQEVMFTWVPAGWRPVERTHLAGTVIVLYERAGDAGSTPPGGSVP